MAAPTTPSVASSAWAPLRVHHVAPFLDAMDKIRRIALRAGATSFAIYRDGADPQRFVEVS